MRSGTKNVRRRPSADAARINANINSAYELERRQEYIAAMLVYHAIAEAILRDHLDGVWGKRAFAELVEDFVARRRQQPVRQAAYESALRWLNGRRNRIVHDIWFRSYAMANRDASRSCFRARTLCNGLFRGAYLGPRFGRVPTKSLGSRPR